VQIPSQRSRIPSLCSDGPVMRLDTHYCLKVSNCSRLHLSGRLSNMSIRSLVFDKQLNFLLRHKYGKTAAFVRTSSLHCPDAILDKARRGEELQLSGRQGNIVWTLFLIMKITCSRSATVRTLGQHCSSSTLIWY
jgi:hypothetical protein